MNINWPIAEEYQKLQNEHNSVWLIFYPELWAIQKLKKFQKKAHFFYFKTSYAKIKKQQLSWFLIKTNKKCSCSITSIYSLIVTYLISWIKVFLKKTKKIPFFGKKILSTKISDPPLWKKILNKKPNFYQFNVIYPRLFSDNFSAQSLIK